MTDTQRGDLHDVRQELDLLIERRSAGGLMPSEQARYRQLADLEVRLLNAT